MARRDPYGKFYPYSYHCDVENPMFVPDFSGQLKDHMHKCDECNGTGLDPSYEDDEDEPCTDCDGTGERGWGCWYGEDRGVCGTCGAENAIVAGMYDHGGGDDRSWVCLVCYVRHHKDECGCDEWKWAEKRLAIFLQGC